MSDDITVNRMLVYCMKPIEIEEQIEKAKLLPHYIHDAPEGFIFLPKTQGAQLFKPSEAKQFIKRCTGVNYRLFTQAVR